MTENKLNKSYYCEGEERILRSTQSRLEKLIIDVVVDFGQMLCNNEGVFVVKGAT